MQNMVAKIYEASVEPDGLSTISLMIRQFLGIDSAGIWLLRNNKVVEIALTPDIQASEPAYLTRYQFMDPWTIRDPARFGRVTLSSNRDYEEAIVQSEFYREFACRYGIHRPMGVVVDIGSGTLAAIAANRVDVENGFTEEDRDRLQTLLIHLETALRLRLRFATLQAAAAIREDALDALSFPLFLCDREGRVGYANELARGMGARGEPVFIAGDRLTGRNSSESRRLMEALTKAAVGPSGVVLTDAHGDTVAVAITPATDRIPGAEGRFLVSLPPRRPPDLEPLLRDAYRLTPAQIELCKALVDGKTFEQAARSRGVATSTMRSHFKAVLDRTGAGNLRDLLRLLTTMPQVR